RAARDSEEHAARLTRGRCSLGEQRARVLHWRLFLKRARHEQLLVHHALDVLELAALARDTAGYFLREVGMTVGPRAHPIHERLPELLLAAEPERKPIRLVGREVAELDRFRRGERRAEILGRSHAEQHEGQALEVGLGAATLIAVAERGEQFAGERLADR